MARNIEIKARIVSVEAMAPTVASVADEGPIEIVQDDTFFVCEAGRLKLRAFSDDRGELIFYRRADDRGPKESFYVIADLLRRAYERRCRLHMAKSGACRSIAHCSWWAGRESTLTELLV